MRKALGRSLEALIPKDGGKSKGSSPLPGSTPTGVQKIPIAAIKPNHLQPRKNIDAERLSELSQSIKEHGLAQPIMASYDAISDTYELIAGERRLRACQLAGFTHIEAVIRTPKDDRERLALALTENIQRDNLNAIETAHALKRLMDEFGVSQADLGRFLGKSKSAISNTLRLLDLPDNIQKALQFERLTEGHARALLMVSDLVERNKLFLLTLDQKLTVRDVERLAQQISAGKVLPEPEDKRESRQKPSKSPNVRAMEKTLEASLGTRVEIRTKKDEKSGKIIIYFYSLEDFDNLQKRLIKQ